jgi:hypothetical protein
MPCERAEQPLSRSALEDTGVPAPMEIMMAGLLEDICLFAYSPQSPSNTWRPRSCPKPRGTWRPQCCPEPGAGAQAAGTRGDPGAAPIREREPELRGHVVAPELPRARSGSPSRGDTWRRQSCSQPGSGSRCLDLKLVRGGTRSSGYRHREPIIHIVRNHSCDLALLLVPFD